MVPSTPILTTHQPHRRLFLLGGLHAEAGGTSVAVPTGQPGQLLALLGLSSHRPRLREQLSDSLWPDAPPDRAARHLSNALYRLRRALGDGWLAIDGERLGLSVSVWIDAAHFANLARSDDPGAWGQAVELYQGELLPEIYADWVLPARLELREHHQRLLAKLGEQAAARSDWASSSTFYDRLIASDPFNEVALRGALRALMALGRSAEALNRYRLFAEVLERELATLPTLETRGLAEDLRREAAVRDAADASRRLPFVGRAAERATALAAVETALGGRGGVLAVEGEAGIGKSRFLEEIAAGARWRGAVVVAGHATEYPAESPLAPLATLLTALLSGARQAQVEAVLPAADLAALAPVYAPWSGRVPLTDAQPAQAWQRFHHALRRLLRTLTEIAPHVVVLDDLQWATDDVWEALHPIVHELAAWRLLVVLAYRRPAIEQTLAWPLLQRWEREGWLKPLALGALGLAEVAQLLRGDRRELAADLMALTGGSPFLVTQALESMSAGERLRADIVQARLDQLPPSTAQALHAAAVCGADVPYALWTATAGLTPVALAEAGDLLSARRLLIPLPAGYRFAHDLLRDHVYAAIADEARRRLHHAAAEHLQTLEPDNHRTHAFHRERAGDMGEAAAAYRRAGEQDLRRLAYASAATDLERSLTLQPDLPRRERIETRLALAQAYDALAARDKQAAAIDAAVREARQLAATPLLLEALLRAGRLAAQTARPTDAQTHYAEAVALATQSADQAQLMEATFLLGELANRQGDHAEAQRCYEMVLAQSRQAGDQWRVARALRGLGMVARRGGQPAAAAGWFEQAQAVQAALGDRVGEAMTRVNLIASYYDLNAWDRLLDLAETTRGLCRDIGRQDSFALVRHLQGLAHLALGDSPAAREELAAALDLYQRLEDQVSAGLARNALGLAAEAEGNLIGAEQDYASALAIAEAAGATTEAAYARHDLGALRLRQGQPAEAMSLLEAARAKWLALGNNLLRLKSEVLLGQACLAMGDATGAERWAETSWAAASQPLSGEQPQAWLWALYELLASLEATERASTVLGQAYAEVQRQAQGIANERRRRQFFSQVPLNRVIVEAHDRLTQTQRRATVTLARIAAPLGRTLAASDLITVTWTLHTPDDELIPQPAERRRHVLRRLVAEAQAQGAAPTDDDLAAALGVSRRTIERDMAALMATGQAPATRRRRSAS